MHWQTSLTNELPTSSSPLSLQTKQGWGSCSSRSSSSHQCEPGVGGGREGQATLSPVGEDFAVVEDLDLQDLVSIDAACHRPAEGLQRKEEGDVRLDSGGCCSGDEDGAPMTMEEG